MGKQGLAAVKAKGKKLGRPKGSKNRERVLNHHRKLTQDYLHIGLNLASIQKIINPQLEEPTTYCSYRYFVQYENEIARAWRVPRNRNPLSLAYIYTQIWIIL